MPLPQGWQAGPSQGVQSQTQCGGPGVGEGPSSPGARASAPQEVRQGRSPGLRSFSRAGY